MCCRHLLQARPISCLTAARSADIVRAKGADRPPGRRAGVTKADKISPNLHGILRRIIASSGRRRAKHASHYLASCGLYQSHPPTSCLPDSIESGRGSGRRRRAGRRLARAERRRSLSKLISERPTQPSSHFGRHLSHLLQKCCCCCWPVCARVSPLEDLGQVYCDSLCRRKCHSGTGSGCSLCSGPAVAQQ